MTKTKGSQPTQAKTTSQPTNQTSKQATPSSKPRPSIGAMLMIMDSAIEIKGSTQKNK